jgi:hypothetical protein
MPPLRSVRDLKHWRDRAARIRAVAVTMADTQAGMLLTDLAVDYDKLAEAVAIKATGESPALKQQAQIRPHTSVAPAAVETEDMPN